MMRELKPKKFDKIMSKHISLGQCSICGHGGGDILVRIPWFGKVGACIKCPKCGYETPLHGVSYGMLCTDGRIGTPVTAKSLLHGILQAIEDRQRRRNI